MAAVADAEPDALPPDLEAWRADVEGRFAPPDAAHTPSQPDARRFVVGTVRLAALRFGSHRFNPREPDAARVHELAASLRRLSLLNPLVCAHLPPGARQAGDDVVALIDGRHRYEALRTLARDEPAWAERARIDVKVYLGLPPSQLFLLATYLNRNRAALRKGEYCQGVARIYAERHAELARARGAPPTERAVFRDLHGRELVRRDLDLSVGRLVGLAAFAPRPEPGWWPLVGNHQGQLLAPETGLQGFAPLTAGNLVELLRPLCRDQPYDDAGEARARELAGVHRLGAMFRRHALAPLASRSEATRSSVASKHWMLAAFGRVLAQSRAFRPAAGQSPLAGPVDWAAVELAVRAYGEVAQEQALAVNRYRATSREEFLARAWSHQTQRDQVAVPLLRELRARAPAVFTPA